MGGVLQLRVQDPHLEAQGFCGGDGQVGQRALLLDGED